jgi:hypothetical protein
MRLGRATVVLGIALVAAGCARLGVGLPDCDTPPSNPSTAGLLSLEAVPAAEFAPCIRSLKLGWDEVDFHVESGLVRLRIGREFRAFLDVTLTPTCEVGSAVEVPSGLAGIRRYEDVAKVDPQIGVTIIPTGERPRIYAISLAEELAGTTVHDRPVRFRVDEDIDYLARQRVNQALFTDQYVWIISDLDIEEGTLEMRGQSDGAAARGITIDEALERIEHLTPEVSYRGQWYLVFEGGCITYDFDAHGMVAETIADDAAEAFGLYPNAALRAVGRRLGYTIVDE